MVDYYHDKVDFVRVNGRRNVSTRKDRKVVVASYFDC
jgi:hypothetical protein